MLHRCDNPKCVRPDHLFLGSNYDNVQDMIAKGRAAPIQRPVGEESHTAKLKSEQVLAIRADPRSRRALADEYGVHYNTIALIKTGQKWKHLLPAGRHA